MNEKINFYKVRRRLVDDILICERFDVLENMWYEIPIGTYEYIIEHTKCEKNENNEIVLNFEK